MGLITNSYARQALAQLGLSAAQLTHLDSAIDSASAAIERYCRRKFVRATYDQVFLPAWDGGILLTQYPVNAISRVAGGRRGVLTVKNTATTTNQRATVAFDYPALSDYDSGLTSQGLKLVWVASAVTTTSTLSFATYPTLSTLAAAVTALGNGWSAAVDSGFESWASSDLVGAEGAMGCLGSEGAEIDVFAEDLDATDYAFERSSGLLNLRGRERREAFVFKDEAPGLAEWGYVRVIWDAGYQTIPADLQDITADIVKNLLIGLAVDPSVSAEAAGEYSYSYDFRDKAARLTAAKKSELALFRNLSA